MANRYNLGFTPEAGGTELKSVAVPMPKYGGDERTQVKTGSNDNLLKLAVILIVILIVGILVIAVFFAKEVREKEDSPGNTEKSVLTTPTTTLNTATPTLISAATSLISTATSLFSTPTTLISTGTTLIPTTPVATCLEESCVRSAAVILGSMNRSVDPCEDFSAFACGGWQAKTFIPTTETSVHTLWTVDNENKQFMRNLLAAPATKAKYSSNRAVTKAIDYYQTCLSKATINAQGDSYLKEVISMLGGSNLTTPNWNSSEYDVEKAMLTAFTKFGVQPFFSVNVFPDFADASKRSFAIFEGGIAIASTYYVETNSTEEFYEKTRSSYRQLMIDVMVVFGADREKAEKQMEQVYLLEKQIATAFTENTGRPHSSTIRQLSNFTRFDWHSFLTGITATQNFTLSKDEVVLVRTKYLMREVTALIRKTDKAIISNYIAWVIMEDVIRNLPDDYLDARLAYKKRIHGDSFDDNERWDFCYEATKEAFMFSIGLMFVDEKLAPPARERAKEIFEEIRNEFLLELNQQTWMDDATRAKAREKAEASTILVGYPDFIKDEQLLNAEYEAIQVNRSEYLKTVFSVKRIGFLKIVANYKKPVDRNGITHSPADVNAYHYRQENKNVFLAGILRAPIYDEGNLRASNYGGIGMIAGHELTHGFDTNGRIYDKNGNLRNWWTKNSSIAFLKKSICIRDQYGEFQMFGKKVDGRLTLGENIADNGGLKFAYEAYKRWVSNNGEEQKLPGLDYTPYQLFFISYAQGWCSKYTLEGALHQLDNLQWPPMNIRVDGAIMNSEGFAEAFKCPKGSRMNPEKKCSVW